MRKVLFVFLLLLCVNSLFAQSRSRHTTKRRTTTTQKVDMRGKVYYGKVATIQEDGISDDLNLGLVFLPNNHAYFIIQDMMKLIEKQNVVSYEQTGNLVKLGNMTYIYKNDALTMKPFDLGGGYIGSGNLVYFPLVDDPDVKNALDIMYHKAIDYLDSDDYASEIKYLEDLLEKL